MEILYSIEVFVKGNWLALDLYKNELSAYRKFKEETEEELWDDVRIRMLTVLSSDVLLRQNEEEELPW